MSSPRLQALPFSLLVDEAWRSTRRNFRRLFPALAVAIAPALLLTQVGSGLWSVRMVGAQSGDFAAIFASLGIFILGGLLVGVYYGLVYGAAMVAVARIEGGRPEPLRAALAFYVRPAVWGTDLLAWILIGVGTMFCLLPGILLMAAWCLRLPVMVMEESTGFAALGRSWQLLSHNPSGQLHRHPMVKALAVVVLSVVLTYAVGALFQLPAGLVSQWIVFRDVASGQGARSAAAAMLSTMWLTIPLGVAGGIAQLAVQLYADFLFVGLYFDQRRRREGSDLEAELSQLTPGPAAIGPK